MANELEQLRLEAEQLKNQIRVSVERFFGHQLKTELYTVIQKYFTLLIIMSARQLCWLPAILFYHCSLDLLSFFFFRRLISEVAWPIVTKLCHMFDGDPDL